MPPPPPRARAASPCAQVGVARARNVAARVAARVGAVGGAVRCAGGAPVAVRGGPVCGRALRICGRSAAPRRLGSRRLGSRRLGARRAAGGRVLGRAAAQGPRRRSSPARSARGGRWPRALARVGPMMAGAAQAARPVFRAGDADQGGDRQEQACERARALAEAAGAFDRIIRSSRSAQTDRPGHGVAARARRRSPELSAIAANVGGRAIVAPEQIGCPCGRLVRAPSLNGRARPRRAPDARATIRRAAVTSRPKARGRLRRVRGARGGAGCGAGARAATAGGAACARRRR